MNRNSTSKNAADGSQIETIQTTSDSSKIKPRYVSLQQCVSDSPQSVLFILVVGFAILPFFGHQQRNSLSTRNFQESSGILLVLPQLVEASKPLLKHNYPFDIFMSRTMQCASTKQSDTMNQPVVLSWDSKLYFAIRSEMRHKLFVGARHLGWLIRDLRLLKRGDSQLKCLSSELYCYLP